MARYAPRSQSHDVMMQKAELARRLLARGLTTRQVQGQLNCSAAFVRRVRSDPDYHKP